MQMIKRSSIDSFKKRNETGQGQKQKDRILDYLRREKSFATRLMISTALDIPTATVSGLITPMIGHEISETLETMPCQISGNKVHWLSLREPSQQMSLLDSQSANKQPKRRVKKW